MFGWFSSSPACPVAPEQRVWLEKSWVWLMDEFGLERIRDYSMVLPTPEFFPDPYDGSESSARAMLDRVCFYMDVDPKRIKLEIFSGQKMTIGDHSSSVLGTYRKSLTKFEIGIEYESLEEPLTMVATMAHELGHVQLLGRGRISRFQDDHEPLTDLLTVYLGMGLFSANSALKETSWRAGNVSGWSIGRQGYLDMRDYGYAYALYARTRHEDGSDWAHHLRPDVRGAFRQTMKLFACESQSSRDP